MTLNGIGYKKNEDTEVFFFEIGDYKVKRYVKTYGHNDKYVSISVTADPEKKYMPDIEYRDGYLTSEKPEFRVQTTAYGALNLDEIEQVMEGYKQAVEVVKILTKNFC